MSDVPSDIAPLLVTPLNHDVVCYTVFTGVAEFFRLNGAVSSLLFYFTF
jgi:hypothetical protein